MRKNLSVGEPQKRAVREWKKKKKVSWTGCDSGIFQETF